MAWTSSASTGPSARGDRLVEQRERVAHRALGGPRDQRQRVRARPATPSRRADAGQMLGQRRRLDAPQLEALAARQDGDRDLADLGGGEDELRVRRRLLDRLQQGVPRLGREHVHLVQDVDLVARRSRAGTAGLRAARSTSSLPVCEAASISITSSARSSSIALAAGADAAGLGRRAALAVRAGAVEAARDDPGGRGLADAADAGEQEGMGDAARGERVVSVRTSASWPISAESRVGR